MQTEKINYDMIDEEEVLRGSKNKAFKLKQSVLKELCRLGRKQNTLLKKHIESSNISIQLRSVTYKQLESMYFDLCSRLNKGIHAKECYPTHYENRLARILKKFSRLKFYQSFWIGNHCIDFYIPRLGLVIEIDGGIHNNEIKMKKDNYAEKELRHIYGLPVSRFNNGTIERLNLNILNFIHDSKKISSKAIKSRNQKIFINTLAHHCSIEQLAHYLGNDFYTIIDIYKKTQCKKGKESLDECN